MNTTEFFYKCDNCGECCRNWNPAQYDPTLVNENGICKYLNQETNLCTIYENRFLFCRTIQYYEECIKNTGMPFDHYMKQQKMGCDLLRSLNNKNPKE